MNKLTVVDEVLDDVVAAGLHSVMQQRAACSILQQQVGPLLLQLHQLQTSSQRSLFMTSAQLPENKLEVQLRTEKKKFPSQAAH